MKRIAVALSAIIAIVFSAPSFSQIKEGKNNELSISGSFQSISSDRSSRSQSAILISPRLGWFVAGGLEIEPEAIVMVGSGAGLSYVLNANVAYNFAGGSNGVPFFLAGYGYANTVPVFGIPATSPDYGLGVLNLGAGMKIFLAEVVAVRLEYRFQQYSGSGETQYYGSGYSSTPETDMTFHIVQFGFSVLL
jgi:opacity protein-like surface antigen